MRLSSAVAPGQLLFLTNDKTRKEVVCQVVKSKNYQNVSGYVELEFTEVVANFWGMRFPASVSSATPQNSAASLAASAAANASTSNSETNLPHAIPNPNRKLKSPASRAHRNNLLQTPRKSKTTPRVFLPRRARERATRARRRLQIRVVEFSKPKPLAPLSPEPASTPSSKSLLDAEEVKIPSWLEPLARNAAMASAAQAQQETAATIKEHADFEDAVEIEDPIPAVVEKPAKAQNRKRQKSRKKLRRPARCQPPATVRISSPKKKSLQPRGVRKEVADHRNRRFNPDSGEEAPGICSSNAPAATP